MVKKLLDKEIKKLRDEFLTSITVENGYDDDTADEVHDDEDWEFIENEDCNCGDCLYSRFQSSIGEFIDEKIYTKIGFLPRMYDPEVNFGYPIQGINYMTLDRKVETIIKSMNRLRVSNEAFRKKNTKNMYTMFYCYDCGAYHKATDASKFSLGGHTRSLCPKHLKAYVRCADCNGFVHAEGYNYTVFTSPQAWDDRRDTSREPADTDTKTICKDCYPNYTSCSACGYLGAEDTMEKVDYRGSLKCVCPLCIERYSVNCTQCGERSIEIRERLRRQEHTVCFNCKEENKVYHHHTYKPRNLHFMTSPLEGYISHDTGFFMGFEFECTPIASHLENQEAMAALLCERFGKSSLYCVSDGTVRYGIEVVTMPFSWAHYLREGRDMWTDLVMYLNGYNWSADVDEAGFHCHTTKAAWGTYQVYKLMQLIYTEKNYNWLDIIAGREPTTYSQREPNDIQYSKKTAFDKQNVRYGHYGMLNMNNKNGGPSKTIEFRMFNGSSEPLLLHKNLEFVHACYIFTRDFPVRHMTATIMTRFIRANHKQYPYLCEYLTMKGI